MNNELGDLQFDGKRVEQGYSAYVLVFENEEDRAVVVKFLEDASR